MARRKTPEDYMKKLGLAEDVIGAYKNGIILCSHEGKIRKLRKDEKEILEKINSEYNYSQFFHVVRGYLHNCEIINVLSCPTVKSEAQDYYQNWLDEGCVQAYGFNIDIPEYSELGNMGFGLEEGGTLVRIC